MNMYFKFNLYDCFGTTVVDFIILYQVFWYIDIQDVFLSFFVFFV